MKIKKYLVIKGTKVSNYSDRISCGGVRVTKHQPKLLSNERAFILNIDVPDELFKNPEISIDVVVPKKLVNRKTITAKTVNNVTEVIEQQLGMDVKITLIEPEIEDGKL